MNESEYREIQLGFLDRQTRAIEGMYAMLGQLARTHAPVATLPDTAPIVNLTGPGSARPKGIKHA